MLRLRKELEYKRRVVGFIIMATLLFFCHWFFLQEYPVKIVEPEKEQEVVKEEQEKVEEPVRVVDPERPMIAITFDDGPGPYTMRLLEQLETCNARATFFMVGTNVSRYPETVQKMMEIGCELGNHTTNHARLTELAVDGIQNEINVTNQAIQNIVGELATLVRPPYGAVNENVQAVAGVPLAMWSVDTRDWETKDAVQVRDYVLGTVQDGDIVLLHDIHETTVQAMMEVIPELINRGYQLVTVSEMAAARGVVLENGKIYGNFRK